MLIGLNDCRSLILCLETCILHPLSVFRPEEPAEERKLFQWDFGSPEAVPLRSSIDCISRCKKRPNRKDSGKILDDSSTSVTSFSANRSPVRNIGKNP